MKKGMGLFLLCIMVLVTSTAFAAPIKEIPYGKKVTLAYPASYTFRFSLWNDETAADELHNMLWRDDNVAITLTAPKLAREQCSS